MTALALHDLDDLDAAFACAWAMLAAGVTDRKAPFHTPTVATIAADGAPSLRTVVLRAADPKRRVLRFHTDRRSRKADEIAADPRIGLHFYDAGAKVQLRLDGRARLLAVGAGGEAAWDASRLFSRACYGLTPGPGAPIASSGAYVMPRSEADILAGAPNFLAVEAEIVRLEWVFLHVDGHRRARFDWTGSAFAGTWLAP